MSLLGNYLSQRKFNKIYDLMKNHVGRCRAIGDTLIKVTDAWKNGNKEEATIHKDLIDVEEASADDLEDEIIKEVATTNLPDAKIKEGLINFVRTLDDSGGGAKRVASNILLIMNYPLPQKYSKIVDDVSRLISKMFKLMEKAVLNIDNSPMIEAIADDIDVLENKMDQYYAELKKGYFAIETSFQSTAAMIILDHVIRDLEFCFDIGENAINLLAGLTYRR